MEQSFQCNLMKHTNRNLCKYNYIKVECMHCNVASPTQSAMIPKGKPEFSRLKESVIQNGNGKATVKNIFT